MFRLTLEQKIFHTLQIAIAMCFIGHGAFGIITKPIWCNYFAVFGIDHDLAYRLMPLVGTVDMLLGIIMLVYPVRAIAAWLVIWGLITALLRPLSGEPLAEFIERAGNFGAPLALLVLTGSSKTFKGWFTRINADLQIDKITFEHLKFLLRFVAFFVLMGHGWLNIIEKKSLIDQYTILGFSNPGAVANTVGIFEILSAGAVLIFPIRSVILLLFFWKVTSELFYPHYELFEWIERGGSYGTLLTLWFVLQKTQSRNLSWYLPKSSPLSALSILRISIGIIYLWFGALKLFYGYSPAEVLATKTMDKITFGIMNETVEITLLGTCECLIGVLLIWGKWLKPVLVLLFSHMICTFAPFFFFPDETFKYLPYGLSLTGQYIVKNIVIISAGLVLWQNEKSKQFASKSLPSKYRIYSHEKNPRLQVSTTLE